jgi:hypothetical protein
MATNPRFTASKFFPEGLWLFVGTAGVMLIVGWRRWQQQSLDLQRELTAMEVAAKESRS